MNIIGSYWQMSACIAAAAAAVAGARAQNIVNWDSNLLLLLLLKLFRSTFGNNMKKKMV